MWEYNEDNCAPDCQERAECENAGEPGHTQCGWCPTHEKPSHHCGAGITH